MSERLAPGAVIGILGGGQLGRMLSVAASRLGYRTHIFEPAKGAPAGHVADRLTTAAYEDIEALTAFAGSVDVVTYEFENVPTSALDLIEAKVPIRPNRKALAISQDRLTEKDYLALLGLKTALYADIPDLATLNQYLESIGTPSILKTRRLGYDGKGQVVIRDPSEGEAALAALKGAPAILEGFVRFEREVSVIVARALSGEVVAFDPGENIHRDGILRQTTVPANLINAQATDAVLIAGKIVSALDYVGVMGVELFVTPGGLVVNEIAPRVHNSGHWTQNGCAVDQFEQHIRAVTGWPLGDGQRYADVVMENLIGDDVDRIPTLAKEPDTAIHLYGKGDVRAGRKMGHINRITRT